LPWVNVATGSLGQGLPDEVGVALAGKYLDRLPYRVWVPCGDGEMAEGPVWEAIDDASHYRLSSLVAIVDVNRLGQRGPTEPFWDLDAYARRARVFGARVEVEGHDVSAIDGALAEAGTVAGDKPTVLLARTRKGHGFSEFEDRESWHGKPLPPAMAERAVIGLGGDRGLRVRGPVPERSGRPVRPDVGDAAVRLPRCEIGAEVATREAYGDAFTALGARRDVVVLDSEVSNSPYADRFEARYPERYSDMFIAEQQLVAAAVGLSVRGYVPFASTFTAFLTSAHDFIRMATLSRADIRLVGIARRALEDLAMMRAVHGSTVLYPSDATSTAALVRAMADRPGVSYLRTTRGASSRVPAGQFPRGVEGAGVEGAGAAPSRHRGPGVRPSTRHPVNRDVEEFGVRPDVGVPLGRHAVLVEDRLDRAHRLACATAHALVRRMDAQYPAARIDAVDGALLDA
jgi:transketolase